jgi:5-methylcytosine-specific restriction endonuclease McrA
MAFSSKEKQAEYNRRYYAKNREKMREGMRSWRAKNLEQHRANSRKYHHENRELILPKQRAHRKENPHIYAQRLRLRKFGLSHAAYQEMLESQNGKCAICKTTGKLVVDHNHQTDAVRSLLCSPCNTAIGLFKEDTDRMRAAIKYLDEQPGGGQL